MEIRYAKNKDVANLFRWRNLKEIREVSTNKSTIQWKDHCLWFNEAVKQTETLLFVIKGDSGSVRIDKIENYGRLSIYILPKFQGKGKGVKAIHEATEEAFRVWDIKRVVAYIRKDNENSLKVFSKVGFTKNNRAINIPDNCLEYEII